MRFAALARRARQLPERVIPHWAKIVRLTTAAVIAYLFAKLVDPSVSDLTGPLTALLVVQSSLTQSLTSGIGRVASVLTGILVAVTLSIWVGLTRWSLGIAIGSALILAHLLRLGDHILETPISAMLILGVSSHDVAAQTRIVNTLIGAAVGMTFNLAFPPAVRVGTIQESIRAVTGSTAEVLHRAAAELREGVDRRQVGSWISEIHQVFPAPGPGRDPRRRHPCRPPVQPARPHDRRLAADRLGRPGLPRRRRRRDPQHAHGLRARGARRSRSHGRRGHLDR